MTNSRSCKLQICENMIYVIFIEKNDSWSIQQSLIVFQYLAKLTVSFCLYLVRPYWMGILLCCMVKVEDSPQWSHLAPCLPGHCHCERQDKKGNETFPCKLTPLAPHWLITEHWSTRNTAQKHARLQSASASPSATIRVLLLIRQLLYH